MTIKFHIKVETQGAVAVGSSAVLGIVSPSIFMRRPSSVPSVVIPSEKSAHQKNENKTDYRIHDEHEKAKHHNSPMPLTTPTNRKCNGVYQRTSSDKAEQIKDGECSTLSMSADSCVVQNHKLLDDA